jgi:hypothetical protein
MARGKSSRSAAWRTTFGPSSESGERSPRAAIVRHAGALGTAAILFVLLAGSPASAQFVCTTTPTDSTCTNSGTATGVNNTATGTNQNATTINSGTNTAGTTTETIAGGNATSTNSGSNSGSMVVLTVAGGNATGTNSGSNSGGLIVETFGGGNATGTNSGSNTGGITVQANGSGNASGTNSGNNAGAFFVVTNNSFFGDAEAIGFSDQSTGVVRARRDANGVLMRARRSRLFPAPAACKFPGAQLERLRGRQVVAGP